MKLYYSQRNKRYEVSEWTPQGRRLIDHDKNPWELSARQGFFEEVNNFSELDKLLISNDQQLTNNN